MPKPCGHAESKPGCHLCYKYETDARYRARWGGMPLALAQIRRPCQHEGAVLEWCTSCGGFDEGRHVRDCDLFDKCTRDRVSDRVHACAGCSEYDPGEPPFPLRYDHTNLAPAAPGLRFNPSVIRFRGKLILAFRNGWAGSDIFLVGLDRWYQPEGEPAKLALYHPQANYGREDPRLFVFRGKLHVAFIGVVGSGGRVSHTSQLYARIGDDWKVEQVFYPHFPARQSWEKSWSMFDHAGELFAVYSVAPHRILRIVGDRAEMAHETPSPLPWAGGELRGGSSPVLVGDEWWCFIHDRVEDHGHRIYRMTCYTFDRDPPFRIRRFLPEPILTADRTTKPHDQYASVVYPCGAVLDGPRWGVSIGVHDRWSELHTFDKYDLEQRMIVVSPPDWWAYRADADDRGIFAHVYGKNEYRLPDDLSGYAVLDVGAHVGTFALAATSRGCPAVHCYEPNAESRELLEKNAAHMRGAVEVFPEAVWDRPRKLTLNATWNTPGSGWVSEDDAGDVSAVGLDDALARLAAAAPGLPVLLKLDCEGGEAAALTHTRGLACVDKVVGEWHPIDYRGRVWDGEAVAAPLREAGFAVTLVPTEDGRGLFFADRR